MPFFSPHKAGLSITDIIPLTLQQEVSTTAVCVMNLSVSPIYHFAHMTLDKVTYRKIDMGAFLNAPQSLLMLPDCGCL